MHVHARILRKKKKTVLAISCFNVFGYLLYFLKIRIDDRERERRTDFLVYESKSNYPTNLRTASYHKLNN